MPGTGVIVAASTGPAASGMALNSCWARPLLDANTTSSDSSVPPAARQLHISVVAVRLVSRTGVPPVAAGTSFATVAAGRSVHGSGQLPQAGQGLTAATTDPAISTAAANPATIAMAAWRGRARAG